MSAPEPKTGICRKCKQTRPLFPTNPGWGRVPVELCSPCWSHFAEARENGTFVDWNDAFDNATDEQLEEQVSGRLP